MSSTLKKDMELAQELYAQRGFQHRVGYGKKPAIINVDLANAWTREGSAFTCVGMENVIANVGKLLEIARRKSIPIFYSTTAYEPSMIDAGLWVKKYPP